MGDLTKGETFAAGEVVSAARLHALVENATINAGMVGTTELADGAVTTAKLDASIQLATGTIQLASGKTLFGNGSGVATQVTVDTGTMATSPMGVKALGIAAAQIAADAVTTAKILDANVTGAKLETLSPSPAGSVGSSSAVPVLTIDSKGRVTAATTASISAVSVTKYASGGTAIPGAGAYANFAHGLGSVPLQFQAYLVCTTTNVGYAAGDRVALWGAHAQSWEGQCFSICADATNVTVTRLYTAGDVRLYHRSTGVVDIITTGSWEIRVVAWS